MRCSAPSTSASTSRRATSDRRISSLPFLQVLELAGDVLDVLAELALGLGGLDQRCGYAGVVLLDAGDLGGQRRDARIGERDLAADMVELGLLFGLPCLDLAGGVELLRAGRQTPQQQ